MIITVLFIRIATQLVFELRLRWIILLDVDYWWKKWLW